MTFNIYLAICWLNIFTIFDKYFQSSPKINILSDPVSSVCIVKAGYASISILFN